MIFKFGLQIAYLVYRLIRISPFSNIVHYSVLSKASKHEVISRESQKNTFSCIRNMKGFSGKMKQKSAINLS